MLFISQSFLSKEKTCKSIRLLAALFSFECNTNAGHKTQYNIHTKVSFCFCNTKNEKFMHLKHQKNIMKLQKDYINT